MEIPEKPVKQVKTVLALRSGKRLEQLRREA
jgi:hypothetical protein